MAGQHFKIYTNPLLGNCETPYAQSCVGLSPNATTPKLHTRNAASAYTVETPYFFQTRIILEQLGLLETLSCTNAPLCRDLLIWQLLILFDMYRLLYKMQGTMRFLLLLLPTRIHCAILSNDASL